MAAFEFTPPAGPSYGVEAMRAMDWVIESAGGADKVKAAIIYDQTDYGKDGHKGWTIAAANHKVEIVSEQTIAPGQKDFVAVVAGLKKAGATHILLTVLPSSTGPILGTAAKMQFMPTWIGNTPSWIDPFFAHPNLPAAVFTNFYWASSLPFWGEERPGMDKFLAAFAAHGKEFGRPDFYILTSYVQGLAALEVAKRAIESGDMTPDGFMKALRGVKGWNAGGLIESLNFIPFPYVTSTRTRVLKPDFTKKSWTVVAGFAEPKVGPAVAAAAGAAPEAKPQ